MRSSSSLLLLASTLLAEQSSVLGLAPLNTPVRTSRQSPTTTSSGSSTQLQYITDSNVDLEAMTANTTLASIWKNVVVSEPAGPLLVAPESSNGQQTPTTPTLQQTRPLSQLHPGDDISGVVVRLLPYGALVQTAYQIPGPTPGCVLLHRARMPVDAPPLAVGQTLSAARVVTVNRRKGQVTVSLRDPSDPAAPRAPLGALQVGDELEGRVTAIHDYGAFVDVGTKRDALLHKSQISPDFVVRVADHVGVGQTVRVRVIPSVNTRNTNLAVTMLTPGQEAAVRERSSRRHQLEEDETARSQLLHDIDEALRQTLTASA